MDTENSAAATVRDFEPGGLGQDMGPARLDAGNEHPNTNIPFTAIIDGRQFSGSSISLVSATVSGLAGAEMDGAERIAVIRFGFGIYSISVPVAARINRTHAPTGAFRLDFAEPAGEHLPILRYLLNSYVAGDIVSLNGIVSLREKAVSGGGALPAAKKTTSQRLAFTGRLLATGLASAALLAVAANLAYQRFLTSDVTQLAVISQGGEAMRAIASGQLGYLNPSAAKGEVVYAIRAASGDTLNVVMPCDCKAVAANVLEGSTVLSGETVVELLRAGAAPSVLATVDSAQAKRLLAGDSAELRFAGGAIQLARLKLGQDAIQALPGSDRLRAVFAMDGPVPDGGLVSVRIVDPRVHALIGRLRSLFSGLASN
jgi:mannuronan synthase